MERERHLVLWLNFLAALAAVSVFCLAGCIRSQMDADPGGAASKSPFTTALLAARNRVLTASGHASLVDHVTIVMMENRSYGNIIGNPDAAYINSLANKSALFTNSYAVSHPSEPNYLAIYSGSTQGITSDACPTNFPGPSLGGELRSAHKTIKGYMEDLPSVGSTVCTARDYRRKHNPLIDFSDTPAQSVVPYSQLSADIAANAYPAVAFVVPNQLHDMHDGTIAMGDAWLAANLPSILAYDRTHKGLLILTWDEDDFSSANHIATIAVGPVVIAGHHTQRITHYSVLRTITSLFGLPALNGSAPITGMLRSKPSKNVR